MGSSVLRRLERELDVAAVHFDMSDRQRILLSEIDQEQAVSVSEARVVSAAIDALGSDDDDPVDQLLARFGRRAMGRTVDDERWQAFLRRVRSRLRSTPDVPEPADGPTTGEVPASELQAMYDAEATRPLPRITGRRPDPAPADGSGADDGSIAEEAPSGGPGWPWADGPGSDGVDIDRLAGEPTDPGPAGSGAGTAGSDESWDAFMARTGGGPSDDDPWSSPGSDTITGGTTDEDSITVDLGHDLAGPVDGDDGDGTGPERTLQLHRVAVAPPSGQGAPASWSSFERIDEGLFARAWTPRETAAETRHRARDQSVLRPRDRERSNRRVRAGMLAAVAVVIVGALTAASYLAGMASFRSDEEADCARTGCDATPDAGTSAPEDATPATDRRPATGPLADETTGTEDETPPADEAPAIDDQPPASETQPAPARQPVEPQPDPAEVRGTTPAPVDPQPEVPEPEPTTTASTSTTAAPVTAPPIGVACPAGGANQQRTVVNVDPTDVLNVRTAPNRDATIVATLAPGASGVDTYTASTSGEWVLIGIPGATQSQNGGCGWVHAYYLP